MKARISRVRLGSLEITAPFGAVLVAGALLLSPQGGRAESIFAVCPGEDPPQTDASMAVDSAAPNPDAPSLPKMALDDAIYVLGSPARWTGKDWAIAGGAAAGLILVSAMADVSVRDSTQKHKSGALDDLTRIVEPFGAEYSWGVLGAYGIVGFAFHDADARDTAIDGVIASALASGIITPSLKRIIGRDRPSQSDDPLSFHPFRGGDWALPSAHATQAFAVASVISAHSEKLWVCASAYTLAGLVAFARVYHNAHWTSDVVAGALIGSAVGHGVVALNRRLRSGDHTVRIVFAPIVNDVARGAGVTVVF